MYEDIIIGETPEELSNLVDSLFDEIVDPVYQNIFLSSGDSKARINDIVYLLAKKKVNSVFNLDSINNKEILEAYKKYISEVKELVDSLKIKNELLCSIIIELLIKRGFFSCSLSFKNVKSHKESVKLHSGTSILLGVGCCRNYAAFYDDVFEGMYNHPTSYGGVLSDDDSTEKSNHVINLINYEDKIYGYDLFNGSPYTFVTPHEMKPDVESSQRLRYRSYWDLIKPNGDTLNKIEENFKIYSQSVGSSIDQEDYKSKVKEAKHIIEDKRYFLSKFYVHTLREKHKVKRKILRKYGKQKEAD